MPIKRPQFVNGEIYHVIIRGIASQKTFLDKKDYLRYFYSLYEFNDKKLTSYNFRSSIQREAFPFKLDMKMIKVKKPKDLLVEILGICLMPNHIHLLVRQVTHNGISLFLQKMGGYSTYFNKKYQRFGALFQRPFRAVHIKNQDQLLIVITYIHLNPIDLIEFNWKVKGISNPQKVIEFLESYPWSSYPCYLGKENFSWLIDTLFLKKIFRGSDRFRDFVKARIFYKTKLKNFFKQVKKFSLE